MASWCWTARSSAAASSFAILLFALSLTGCAKKPPLPTFGAVPDFQLTDQTGAAFASAASLRGKVWVADFIFTNCPGPCPMMSSKMNKIQKELTANADARLVSFTIDPARDTPPVLAEYAKHFEAQPGRWFFLTGPVPALNSLSKDAFHLSEIDGKNLEHSVRMALVDQSSQIRGFYVSTDQDVVPHLVADARRLIEERP